MSPDQALTKVIRNLSGFRYLDDYEFAFSSYADAETALSALQSVLSDYGLMLNPRKTSIIDLPEPIDAPWAVELRSVNSSNHARTQYNIIVHLFSKAFELVKRYPSDNVLQFALGIVANLTIQKENWDLFENLLLQCIQVEPATLERVLNQFKYYESAEIYPIDKDKIADSLNKLIVSHARKNHHSEVAWAIWGCILLDLKFSTKATKEIQSMENAVIALLGLDAAHRGLIKPESRNFTKWLAFMTEDELKRSNWLLAYEATIKGWLVADGANPNILNNDLLFSKLKEANVSFYNDRCREDYEEDEHLEDIINDSRVTPASTGNDSD